MEFEVYEIDISQLLKIRDEMNQINKSMEHIDKIIKKVELTIKKAVGESELVKI